MLDNDEQLAKIITMENVSAKYMLPLEIFVINFTSYFWSIYSFWHLLLIWQSLFSVILWPIL